MADFPLPSDIDETIADQDQATTADTGDVDPHTAHHIRLAQNVNAMTAGVVKKAGDTMTGKLQSLVASGTPGWGMRLPGDTVDRVAVSTIFGNPAVIFDGGTTSDASVLFRESPDVMVLTGNVRTALLTPKTVVAADYTLVADDAGKVIEVSNLVGAPRTITIPAGLFPIGAQFWVRSRASYPVTVTSAVGASIEPSASVSLTISEIYGSLHFRQDAFNVWSVSSGGGGGVATVASEIVAGPGLNVATAGGIATITNLHASGFVRRTADNQIANNNVTMTSDPVLVLPVAQNNLYRLEMMVGYKGTNTANIKFGFAFSAGITMNWTANALAPGLAAAGVLGTMNMQYLSQVAVATCGASTANNTALITGLVSTNGMTGATGTVTFQAAQNTLEVSNVTLLINSYMLLTRVA